MGEYNLYFIHLTDIVVEFSHCCHHCCHLHLKCRYDSSTGMFTVPPGGNGFYYFSTFLVVNHDEYGSFEIRINGEILCTAYTEQHDQSFDPGQAACSGAAYVTEGMNNL